MAIILGSNQYGKAETRVVRITRHDDRHEITDLNVSVALTGDFESAHLTGDNVNILPTDTQKNTVYAFAREHGVEEIETFGLALARHFVDSQPQVTRARVAIDSHAWERLADHSFARRGQEVRTAQVTCDAHASWVVSGLRDLVVLNSTDSEFWGFVHDRYTTLPETRERMLATAIDAQWRHDPARTGTLDWNTSHAEARRLMLDAFAGTYSYSLQQTLYAMGRSMIEHRPEISEVRFSLPNKHHFLVDLAPFGLDNPDEVYIAADRPYGLIEGNVLRKDAPPPGHAW